MNFATVEIKAVAATILRRFELTPEPGQEIRQVYQGTGRPLQGIKMQVQER